MEITIYCIEDINDLQYVGSTKRALNIRLNEHRQRKRDGHNTSSNKLNLENCIIYELEKCDKSKSKEREKYWIDKLNSVNTRRLDADENYHKQYYLEHRDKILSQQKEYYKKKLLKIETTFKITN